MHQQKRRGQTLAVVYIDLDGFKGVNDRFGHNAGDEVLVQVSQVLTNIVRESDVVVRWGGDEFMIIGHSKTFSGVKLLAERVRETLDTYVFEFSGGVSRDISASIGIAPYPFAVPDVEIDWEQVSRIADKGAYLAKENGRNGWVSIEGTQEFVAEDLQRISTDIVGLIDQGHIRVDSSYRADFRLSDSEVGVAAS